MPYTKEERKTYMKEYNQRPEIKTKQQDNKEDKKNYDKEYRQDNKEHRSQYHKEWRQTETGIKHNTIKRWKKLGISLDYDFHEIYDWYICTDFCNVCEVELVAGLKENKCLSIHLLTGEINGIVCKKCDIEVFAIQ